jgi:hypothetical protein
MSVVFDLVTSERDTRLFQKVLSRGIRSLTCSSFWSAHTLEHELYLLSRLLNVLFKLKAADIKAKWLKA